MGRSIPERTSIEGLVGLSASSSLVSNWSRDSCGRRAARSGGKKWSRRKYDPPNAHSCPLYYGSCFSCWDRKMAARSTGTLCFLLEILCNLGKGFAYGRREHRNGSRLDYIKQVGSRMLNLASDTDPLTQWNERHGSKQAKNKLYPTTVRALQRGNLVINVLLLGALRTRMSIRLCAQRDRRAGPSSV